MEVEESLRTTYKTFEVLSFWMLGVWLMLLLSPIILPILLINAAKESKSMWD